MMHGGPCDCSCQHMRPNEALTGRGEGVFDLFNERVFLGFGLPKYGAAHFFPITYVALAFLVLVTGVSVNLLLVYVFAQVRPFVAVLRCTFLMLFAQLAVYPLSQKREAEATFSFSSFL